MSQHVTAQLDKLHLENTLRILLHLCIDLGADLWNKQAWKKHIMRENMNQEQGEYK